MTTSRSPVRPPPAPAVRPVRLRAVAGPRRRAGRLTLTAVVLLSAALLLLEGL